MNLKEGARRLAVLLGVVGAILGGFASYVELQPVMRQRAEHKRFEQLANSPVVQEARKSCFESNAASEHGPWEKYQAQALPPPSKIPPPPSGTIVIRGAPRADFFTPPYCFIPVDDPNASDYTPSELNSSEIKTAHFENRDIASIETTAGQTVYPTPAPVWWAYLLIGICPVLGFFLPWGAVRAIGWVGAGFLAGPR